MSASLTCSTLSPDLADPEDRKQLPVIKGRVEFDHVKFSYKDDEPVIHDLTLQAEPGQRIALVGETGSGKSTLIRLLSRFFDVTEGAIKLDGYDLREVTQASLRSQMGIVLQDTFLFGGTIADNIRYGYLNATDEQVVTAAKTVGADAFIRQLPRGYQTEVGEKRGQPERGAAPNSLLRPSPTGRSAHPHFR